MEPTQWLTVAEAAEALALSPRTVQWRIHHGHLTAVKRGSVWLIDPDSVSAELGRERFQRRPA